MRASVRTRDVRLRRQASQPAAKPAVGNGNFNFNLLFCFAAGKCHPCSFLLMSTSIPTDSLLYDFESLGGRHSAQIVTMDESKQHCNFAVQSDFATVGFGSGFICTKPGAKE